MIPDWSAFLNSAVRDEEHAELRRHGRRGRPLGDETFLGRLEELVGRSLKPKKRGPKAKQQAN
jgi:putative transposase